MKGHTVRLSTFQCDRLAECDPIARLLYVALHCLADAEGRLDDRPAAIKAAVLPFDAVDAEGLLGQLASRCLIDRVGGSIVLRECKPGLFAAVKAKVDAGAARFERDARLDQAKQVVEHYQAAVAPDHDRSRGVKNVLALLNGGADPIALKNAADRYAEACRAKGTEPKYRRAVGNFYGVAMTYQEYAAAPAASAGGFSNGQGSGTGKRFSGAAQRIDGAQDHGAGSTDGRGEGSRGEASRRPRHGATV
jgi:hypothetical protein